VIVTVIVPFRTEFSAIGLLLDVKSRSSSDANSGASAIIPASEAIVLPVLALSVGWASLLVDADGPIVTSLVS